MLPLLTFVWTAESDQQNARFGVDVSSAGDVNGDGYGDVLVGAPRYDDGSSGEGRAYLYLGSPVGLATTAAWTAESEQTGANFGEILAHAGDVNGDGFADVVVGAEEYDNGSVGEGRAYLFLGSASGLGTTAVWTTESDQAEADYGDAVSTAGDVDGDGFADVVVGAEAYDGGSENEGKIYVYRGSASGLETSAAWTVESDQANTEFGSAVCAGDVNGDGYGDVVVGAWMYDHDATDEGGAFLYLGSATGLEATSAWTAESDQANAQLGSSVDVADVNGDGHGDVVVGANLYDDAFTNEGRAYLYLGSPDGLDTAAAWTAESDQADADFADSVSSAGDVNGDGYDDLVVGAEEYDGVSVDQGRAFVYFGSASGLVTSTFLESDQESSFFGASVSTAGDVNGDACGDLIVGAPFHDGGSTDEGKAFLYEGACHEDPTDTACEACPPDEEGCGCHGGGGSTGAAVGLLGVLAAFRHRRRSDCPAAIGK